MKVKLLNGAKAPERKRAQDAGYDFYLAEDLILPPGEIVTVNTGVCVELPDGYAGLLALRSSMCKKDITLFNPLIDSNYRGEIHALLKNNSAEALEFKAGERVYSMYVFPVFQEAIEVVDELSDTDRGEAWNGSSGK